MYVSSATRAIWYAIGSQAPDIHTFKATWYKGKDLSIQVALLRASEEERTYLLILEHLHEPFAENIHRQQRMTGATKPKEPVGSHEWHCKHCPILWRMLDSPPFACQGTEVCNPLPFSLCKDVYEDLFSHAGCYSLHVDRISGWPHVDIHESSTT